MSDHDGQPEPLGPVIDALGVNGNALDPADLIASAVVLLKMVTPDGRVYLSVRWSDGMSWLERVGMFHVAEQQDTPLP